MLKYLRVVFFVVFAISQVALCEDVPENCRQKLKKEAAECCDDPKMFPHEEWVACGFSAAAGGPPTSAKSPQGPCEKTVCLFKKYDLITGEDKVNKIAFKALIDKRTKANPDLASLGRKYKSNCFDKDLASVGPQDVCEPMKIHHCMQKTRMFECSKWKKTPECAQAQQHVKDCKPHFDKLE